MALPRMLSGVRRCRARLMIGFMGPSSTPPASPAATMTPVSGQIAKTTSDSAAPHRATANVPRGWAW